MINEEDLEMEITVALYDIADVYSKKLEELGKQQAQYAILGMGADRIMKILKDHKLIKE